MKASKFDLRPPFRSPAVPDGTSSPTEVVSLVQPCSPDPANDATAILKAIGNGEPQSAEKLLDLVYQELRRLAASKMARETPGQTLQPTALVHEAWLRLVGSENRRFENRAHFFSAAAEAMRRILIDRARRKLTHRHGANAERIPVEECDIAAPEADDQLLAVHEALNKLALKHPIQAELVKLRYFAGLTLKEIAELLGISVGTAKNYWVFSRTRLFHEIKKS